MMPGVSRTMRSWRQNRKAKNRQPRPERPLLVGVLTAVAGLAFGGWLLYGTQQDRQLIEHGASATGTVLNTREQFAGRPRDGLRETIATVSFSTPGPYGPSPERVGQVVRSGWPVPRDNAPAAEPGQTVTVFYDPADPAAAVVEGWERRYLSWWLALALLFSLGGILAACKAWRDAAIRRRARRIQASW